jgi:hypothetical protein
MEAEGMSDNTLANYTTAELRAELSRRAKPRVPHTARRDRWQMIVDAYRADAGATPVSLAKAFGLVPSYVRDILKRFAPDELHARRYTHVPKPPKPPKPPKAPKPLGETTILIIDTARDHPDWTLEKISEVAGVSRERVRQIIAKYAPDLATIRKDTRQAKLDAMTAASREKHEQAKRERQEDRDRRRAANPTLTDRAVEMYDRGMSFRDIKEALGMPNPQANVTRRRPGAKSSLTRDQWRNQRKESR